MPSNVTLDTIFGPLEVRRRRSASDTNKIPPDTCGFAVEQALRDVLAWGNRMPLLGLVHRDALMLPSFGTDEDQTVAAVMDALRRGALIVASPEGVGSEGDAAQAVWSAYYTFQARFGKEFNVGMRRHRLAGREQVPNIRQAEDYDVVPAAEAAAMVVSLSRSAGAGQWHNAALTLAKNLVDMRSPPNANGFMLLRAPASQAERIVSPEDVITPAKLKKLAERDWIEVRLVDQDGNPWAGDYELVAPGGAVFKGTAGEDGFIRVEKILSGSCSLALPELEPSRWDVSSATSKKQ